MQALDSLRAQLLEQLPDLQPEDLVVRIRNGRVRHHYEHPEQAGNHKFSVSYELEILARDYRSAPEALLFLVAQWLSEQQPGHGAEALSFELDRLDNTTYDVIVKIKDLSQVFSPQLTAEGTLLHACLPRHLEA